MKYDPTKATDWTTDTHIIAPRESSPPKDPATIPKPERTMIPMRTVCVVDASFLPTVALSCLLVCPFSRSVYLPVASWYPVALATFCPVHETIAQGRKNMMIIPRNSSLTNDPFFILLVSFHGARPSRHDVCAVIGPAATPCRLDTHSATPAGDQLVECVKEPIDAGLNLDGQAQGVVAQDNSNRQGCQFEQGPIPVDRSLSR